MPDPATYRKIAAELRELIAAGEYPPHVLLPSEVTLCQRFGVRRGTIRRVLTKLTNEGLIEVLPGYGRRVAPTAEDPTGPPRTAYHRVMDHIRALMTAKNLGPDDPLPSETALMRELGVSRNTVRRAYQELGYEGVVVVHHGRGAYPAPPRE